MARFLFRQFLSVTAARTLGAAREEEEGKPESIKERNPAAGPNTHVHIQKIPKCDAGVEGVTRRA